MRPHCLMPILILFTGLSTVLFSKSEISIEKDILKVRSSGVCFLDPGITVEQAAMIARYDAVNEALNDLGSFLEENDSILTAQVKKEDIYTCLANRLPVTVYFEGEQDIDGYPSYLSNISTEILIPNLESILKKFAVDNRERYLMKYEEKRLRKIIKDINFLKISTNKIPKNFITDLFLSMAASDWACKAHLSVEEGLKIEYYSISIDNDQNYESSYIYLAESLLKTGQNSLLMGMLNKLINIDPLNFPAAYALRGHLYYIEKHYPAAIKELEKSYAIEPSFVYPLCLHGSVLAEQKKYDEALAKFAEAIEKEKNYTLPYLLRANLYRKNGKYDEALRDYSSVSVIDPLNAEAHVNSGIIHYLTGKYEKAVAEYTKALELDPASPSNLFNRAISYRKTGSSENASADYEKYLFMTVKDLKTEEVTTLVESWMARENYSPILPD